MYRVRLERPNDLGEWRSHARRLLAAGVAPEEVVWQQGDAVGELFGDDALPAVAEGAVGTVPRGFIELASSVLQHAEPERFALLYRLLWRLQSAPQLLADAADRDISALSRMASAVRRDAHKMKAFVRFRELRNDAGAERFVAWFEPDHYVLEATAPFFARRFAGMHWGIVTPYASAWWDTDRLAFGPGGTKTDVPAEDAVEEDWKTYYASIFNPARLKVAMMKSEMPVKYWSNLPEAALIEPLVRNAKAMEEEMIARAATQPPARHLRRKLETVEPVDSVHSLGDAGAAVQACKRCPLYEHATQAVFGQGPERAEVMFVGEQPGDQEDLQGRPFVGPAGQVLDDVIEKVGIDRNKVYVTNAVKHFKFEPRGKRRIHQRPDGGEVQACKFWLNLERDFVRPKVIVALGATAAQSLLGKASVTVSKMRGQPMTLPDGSVLFITNHPSYLLRIPDVEGRQRERAKFEADLAVVREMIEALENSARAVHGA
ncbi:UdgX family uracil-DNA binding protein [Devosia sp. 63-57]|uniref:UdgX family uracil-DNA binding protein n=1 Tax=Devosia sp. 63-57 TaxID=1895751 RepID=UPI000868A2E6|nr:UdgX family uracil-DNA binding protein [Devosia sp. 63-57]ODT48864.1 MAG: uracil-DNA glycosylase [Pelagibacterium sp. SCN 63-126]ODU86848.1 MAG: uracil-DNA glycosylase [Pelagibacterium sp. SCN 63-17]OJX44208.1 MAG: uracil-DNA glycosylase [Devosia sp. 63-57]